jgi:hypothetical protein
MNPTGRVGAFVAGCAHETLPDSVREKAAICFLDAQGLANAARNEQTAVAARAAATNAVSVGEGGPDLGRSHAGRADDRVHLEEGVMTEIAEQAANFIGAINSANMPPLPRIGIADCVRVMIAGAVEQATRTVESVYTSGIHNIAGTIVLAVFGVAFRPMLLRPWRRRLRISRTSNFCRHDPAFVRQIHDWASCS